MPQGFQVTGRVDADARRIVFSARGEIDSRVLMDRIIEIYSGIAEPWTYDRVFDYRRSDGLIEFVDVERLAAWWAAHIDPDCAPTKVAVIVNNPLDLARARSAGPLFPKDQVQSFLSLDEALRWLEEE